LRIDYLQFGLAGYIFLSMAYISWEKKFNTGIREIDTQHQRLVDIINEFYDARHSQSPQAVLNVILSKLIDYAWYHFDFEEALISRVNCLKLKEHKAEHQQFRDKIKEILDCQDKEQFIVEDTLLKFLQDWLTHHILIEDMEALSVNH